MIAHQKEFYSGSAMLVGFIVILILVFSPLFNGQNGLEYLDNLYNSISKGSANYITDLQTESTRYNNHEIDVTLTLTDANQAGQTALLFTKSGAQASASQNQVQVAGDLGQILANCLDDAWQMYNNAGEAMKNKYGYGGKRVLYHWWLALKEMDKALKIQKQFKEAKIVITVKKKAIESAYNYYGITPQKIGDSLGVVVFSLLFYVLYTLWYGFAILFMFEGWGLRLEH